MSHYLSRWRVRVIPVAPVSLRGVFRDFRFWGVVALLVSFVVPEIAMAGPTAYTFTAPTGMPADVSTIVTNAVTSIYLLTGGAATLSAARGSVGLISGLIMRMFS